MKLASQLRSWLRSLFARDQRDREIGAEFTFHIDEYACELESGGVPRAEALRQARLKFGSVSSLSEDCREATRSSLVETFVQDLRFGARSMLRSPGFTVIAVLALALGIGANAAIFSVVNAVLLRPLAYQDSDRLVTILHNGNGPVSPANFADWQAQAKSFEAMADAEVSSVDVTNIDTPEHVEALAITQNMLPMLGVQPLLGRWFAPGEDKAGAPPVVLLSYRYWQDRFGGDPSAIGKQITADGKSFTVIGVMPKTFAFAPFWATKAQLWFPFVLHNLDDRGFNSTRVFARLASGVTIGQAQAEMAGITARLDQQFPGTNKDITVTSLKEKVVGRVQAPLLILFASVGLVLLIACANVAHMLLARAAARQKEFAVRTAIGASRARLVRQFLTENLLLSALGGLTGLALAYAGVRALVALAPAELPRVNSVTIDAPVVAFLIGVTALCSVAFGLAPALQSSTVHLSETLKESGRGTSDSAGKHRLRAFLVISEFALALILLTGAGLLARSFVALRSIDPGFEPHHVLSMIVSIKGAPEFPAGPREAFYRELLDRVRALPGVESAGAVNHLPIEGDVWGWGYRVADKPIPPPQETPDAIYRVASPGYFEAMRLPIVMGRAIAAGDVAAAQHVAVVNEAFAKKMWPAENPLGKRLTFNTEPEDWLTIVGVSKNAVQSDWTAPADPEVFTATTQDGRFLGTVPRDTFHSTTLVIRTTGDPAALTNSVKSLVWSMDKNLPISDVVTMDEVVATANAEPRFELTLLAAFASVALLLAAVGIYGVMSYTVSRRTHEIGIRVSLGAGTAEILKLVFREAIALAGTGLVIGLVGALLLSRLMSGLLYGVHPTDPLTFVGVAALLLFVAALATYFPARRAILVDPMVALRYE
jgi:predicted permease